MKIRVLSDLHLDINEEYPFSLEDKDTFTVLCGDISGNSEQTTEWIKSNIRQGIFVEGNHIGYDSKHSIQYIEELLAQCFPTTAPVSYLKDTYKIIDEIVFVGGVLWTDFNLYGNASQPLFKLYAAQLMNDFRYNYANPKHVNIENDGNFRELVRKQWIRKLLPNDTIQIFNATLQNIDNICKRFPDKKIVVVTHHAPSEQSVPEIYKTDKTTPAFASNLEQFILDRPNIKLWCHGHIHTASNYTIGDCHIVCNPRGYVKYCEKTGFILNKTITL